MDSSLFIPHHLDTVLQGGPHDITYLNITEAAMAGHQFSTRLRPEYTGHTQINDFKCSQT